MGQILTEIIPQYVPYIKEYPPSSIRDAQTLSNFPYGNGKYTINVSVKYDAVIPF